jgi:YVTN family beta-propeller protein
MTKLLSTVLLLVANTGLAATDLKVMTRYPVQGPAGGWDYITVDSDGRRIYVAHANQVEVLDADSGKTVGSITDTPGVHGIAIATGTNRGFTSNGRESKVSIFDTQTLKLIEKVDVGKGPDGIYYDAASKRIFTCNHGSDDVTAIDAATGKVVGTVKVEGAGEQMVTGKDGTIYVNLEDKSEVVAFNPVTLAVTQRFPIGVGKEPTGLAMDKANNRLFIGCGNELLVVMNAANGKVITTFPIGKGVDAAEFDADRKLIYASTGDGNLTVIHQLSADKYEDVGPVKTQQTARTMALDTKTHQVLLPAAEMENTPGADPKKKFGRRVKAGTFVVLVVSK